ncbi:hypothetical protein ABG768_020451 [Culter alburnus]|uniref:Ig-like domain-containing protein n=1 Tax=Culter alburnus TaxID=194366 RepID=A0AAW2B114_CULAL
MRSSVILLLVGISLAFAGKHSLKYFYTSVSGDKNFTATGLVDDVQFMYFNVNTKKASPKTEWMRDDEESDFWKRQTHSLIEQHHWILNNIWTESAGEHTYQITYGCEWNDKTGKTNAFRQYGYDGEDFLFLDLKRDEWISPIKKGFRTQERCNNETIRLVHWKYYLEIDCIETLKKLLTLGKSSLEKTVSPQVSLSQKNSSSPLLCHVTHFYPSDITITWMRNGQELYKNVKVGKLLPNEDGTFQKTVTLQTEPDEWRKNEFICVVKHQSKTFRKTLTEKEIRTKNKTASPVDVTVVVVPVVVILLLLIIGVIVYLVYSKKKKSVGVVLLVCTSSDYDRPHRYSCRQSPIQTDCSSGGKGEVGKSAAGNTILGQKEFNSEMSASSLTREYSDVHATVSGRSVSVVDTPAILDTHTLKT